MDRNGVLLMGIYAKGMDGMAERVLGQPPYSVRTAIDTYK